MFDVSGSYESHTLGRFPFGLPLEGDFDTGRIMVPIWLIGVGEVSSWPGRQNQRVRKHTHTHTHRFEEGGWKYIAVNFGDGNV